jgi:hypothetical protein
MRNKTGTKPATRKPAKVKKIIASPHPEIPEKAEISIQDCDDLYRELRIDNSLTEGTGNEVKLKPGAEVEVTIEADKKDTTPKDFAQDQVHGRPSGKPC